MRWSRRESSSAVAAGTTSMATTRIAPTASKPATVASDVAIKSPVVTAATGTPAARAASASNAVKTCIFQVAIAATASRTNTAVAVRNARGTSTPKTGTVSNGTSSNTPWSTQAGSRSIREAAAVTITTPRAKSVVNATPAPASSASPPSVRSTCVSQTVRSAATTAPTSTSSPPGRPPASTATTMPGSMAWLMASPNRLIRRTTNSVPTSPQPAATIAAVAIAQACMPPPSVKNEMGNMTESVDHSRSRGSVEAGASRAILPSSRRLSPITGGLGCSTPGSSNRSICV